MSKTESTKVFRLCEQCGNEFWRYPSQTGGTKGRFCGRRCKGIARRNAINTTCKFCSVPFLVNPSVALKGDGKYCSVRCRALDRIMSLADRLASRSGPRQDNGCIPWLGITKKGYGMIQCVGGRVLLAHRVAYEVAYGTFDKQLCVLHKCDNPTCVNPEHLFLGTQQDNVDDMYAKGRSHHQQHNWASVPRGEQCSYSKLNDVSVIRIRELANAGIKTKEIKSRLGLFGVSCGAIDDAAKHRTWKHIT